MNIAEILKDCPKGTKLYSPLFGDVLFEKIAKTEKHPIYVRTCIGNAEETFTNSGLFCYNYPGECMLFPSKKIEIGLLPSLRKYKNYYCVVYSDITTRYGI